MDMWFLLQEEKWRGCSDCITAGVGVDVRALQAVYELGLETVEGEWMQRKEVQCVQEMHLFA